MYPHRTVREIYSILVRQRGEPMTSRQLSRRLGMNRRTVQRLMVRYPSLFARTGGKSWLSEFWVAVVRDPAPCNEGATDGKALGGS